MRLGLIAVLMCAAAAGVGAQEQPVAQPPECAVGCPPPGSGMGQACYMRTPPALRPQRPEIIIGGPPTTPSGTPFIGGPTSPSATPSTPILSGPPAVGPPARPPDVTPEISTPAAPTTPSGIQRGVRPGGVAPVTPGTPGAEPVGAPAPEQPGGSLPNIPPAPAYIPPSPTLPTTISPPVMPGSGGSVPIGIPPASVPGP